MSLNLMFRSLIVVLAVLLGAPAEASDLTLNAVQYPERKTVKVDFASTSLAPRAELSAKVVLREGQGDIQLSFDHLRPAVLYGGDVTSYVLWAVTRDGKAENLGEVWAREEKDKPRFATAFKSFALLVTAEPYPSVERPSDMALFYSLAVENRRARSEAFTFASFAPSPVFEVTNIDNYRYAGEVPLDLLQAEKAFEIAQRQSASDYAPGVMEEARITLAQARNLSRESGRQRVMLDYSRRSVALSSEALRVTARAVESERLEAREAGRRDEIDALAGRTSEAERARELADTERRLAEAERREAVGDRRRADEARVEAEAQQAGLNLTVEQIRGDLAAMRSEREELSANMSRLSSEKAALEAETASLGGEKQVLEQEKRALQAEKAELHASVSSLEQTKIDLESTTTRLGQEKRALERERDELAGRSADLEGETRALTADKAELEARAGGLEAEKAELAKRLQGALSSVAETRGSARGFIVNLPDILFDVDQATIKPQAQLALAKLMGILAFMPELNLRIEGHTDSTGSAEHNLKLSQDRAKSVYAFLDGQELDRTRMATFGYGLDRPIADNATRDGRASNRRVEIVIAEGEVAEDPHYSSLR